MLIRATPGVNPADLHRTLVELATEASNAQGRGGIVSERYDHYVRWADAAILQLWRMVSSEDLDRLVRTRAYWALAAAPATAVSTAITSLVEREFAERIEVFKDVSTAVGEQIKRWSRFDAFVVADTSVFIKHPDKFEVIDFPDLLGERPTARVHVLIPIVVVDELDGLKQHNDRHVRWRSRYTLAVIDRLFAPGRPVAHLREEVDYATADRTGGRARGPVSVEVVFDPPGHTRLPINDDEIVDRTLAIEALAGRRVALITYDTGQATRARNAGLVVHKRADPPEGDEPASRVSADR